jgi:ubiquinone/menaquinone biosynthesis C-methylase UbiE
LLLRLLALKKQFERRILELIIMTASHEELMSSNQKYFNSKSANYDEDCSSLSIDTFEIIMEHLESQLSTQTTSVLNFGCGTGSLEAQLKDKVHHITGLDISQGMVDQMNEKIRKGQWPNVTTIVGDILSPSFQSIQTGSFDLILSCFTFHHLHDIKNIGEKLLQYLKPNGFFCLVDLAFDEDSDFHKMTAHGHDHSHSHSHGHDRSHAHSHDGCHDRSHAHKHGNIHNHNHAHAEADDEEEQNHNEDHGHKALLKHAKPTLGSHVSFTPAILKDYFEKDLKLIEVHVFPARPIKHREMECPTLIAFGKK